MQLLPLHAGIVAVAELFLPSLGEAFGGDLFGKVQDGSPYLLA